MKFKLGTTPIVQDDCELSALMKEHMKFVRDKRLIGDSMFVNDTRLKLINRFREDYENTDQDTAAWAVEFVIVARKISMGYRPVRLFYLTDFEGEHESARDAHSMAHKAKLEAEVLTPAVIVDILCLVLEEHEMPTLEEVKGWTWEQQEEARRWAGATHLRASDNDDVEVPPRPVFLPRKTKTPCDCTLDIYGRGHTCGKQDQPSCPRCGGALDVHGNCCKCLK